MRKSLLYSVLVAMTVIIGVVSYAPTVEAASKPRITTFTESNVNTGTKLKITFKSAGTKSYKVQISTKKSSGFKKVSYKKNDTGKNEAYTIKKVGSTKIKENKTYYVRVTVYSKKNYKGVKTTKTYKVYSAPTTAKISVSKLTDSTAKISWKKVSGATKYQVKMNGKTDTQKGLSKAYTNLGASTDYTVAVRSYKQVKVNGKSVKLYSAWKTLKFQTAVSSGDSTANEIVYVDTLSYGEWQNVKTISTVKQSAENEKRTEDTDVYNGVAMSLYYAFDDNGGKGNVGAIGRNNVVVHFAGYENQNSWHTRRDIFPNMYKIGTLTTEATPVYNVTTEDMSEAYRTVTTVTYYSDGTSKTSSTTQYYTEWYNQTHPSPKEFNCVVMYDAYQFTIYYEEDSCEALENYASQNNEKFLNLYTYYSPTSRIVESIDTSRCTYGSVDSYGACDKDNNGRLSNGQCYEIFNTTYTYRINQYYAELFDEDGDGINSNNKVWLSGTEYLLGSNLYYKDEVDIENITVIFE